MKANPGGEIATQDVVGRNRFIERLWETLEQQSIVLVSERRMGKSCVIKKMRAENSGKHLAFYADLEGLETPIDFAERVFRDVYQHLSTLQRAASRAEALLSRLAGAEIANVGKFPQAAAPHWRDLLEATIADLAEHHNRPVIFFWDELPLMLQKIKSNSGETAAMGILDVLRSLRQTYSGLRMVYAGSIGLHHVLSVLREAGHMNDATNDMRTIELPPLHENDAQFLAGELIQGEQLKCADVPATAEALARETDCIPFYIHHVVAAMRDRGTSASESLAREIVSEFLVHPQDPWHFNHYRNRLEEYYGKDRVPVVLYLLDELAVDAAVPFDVLFGQLGAHLGREHGETARQILDGDREQLRRLLELLQGDHYVVRQPEGGAYRFRFPLIRRWWRLHRSLP
jgi:hypothetical protein